MMIDAFFHIVERDVRGLTQDLINLDFLTRKVDPATIRPVVEKLFSDYLNLRLGDIRFKELTYELAEVMYEYPFTIPANFTYIIRAIMTLEGIGIAMDPNFSFFDVARPFAKEFMLKREGRFMRDQILKKLIYGENNQYPMGQSLEACEDGRPNVLRRTGQEFHLSLLQSLHRVWHCVRYRTL